MFGRIFRYLFHLVVCVLIFFGLAWLLLDIPPVEAYHRSIENLTNLSSRFSSFSKRTYSGVKESVETQRQHTSDRFHGKDPYERAAQKIDAGLPAGRQPDQESN